MQDILFDGEHNNANINPTFRFLRRQEEVLEYFGLPPECSGGNFEPHADLSNLVKGLAPPTIKSRLGTVPGNVFQNVC